MTAKKSEYNACPVCGKPRGVGKYEFAHGKCAEIRAATEGKKPMPAFKGKQGSCPIKVESHEKAQHNAVKKQYLSGKKLPDWMFS